MKIWQLTLTVAVIVLLMACKGRKQAYVAEGPQLPPGEQLSGQSVSMRTTMDQATVEWRGKTWIYEISRRPDSTLTAVTDDEGLRCIDNRVSLRVSQGDNEVLRREFTKADFRPYLPEDFYTHSLLEGLVFYRAADEGLQFATSVSYPHGDDMYISLLITVAPDGSVRIRQDDLIDEQTDDNEAE